MWWWVVGSMRTQHMVENAVAQLGDSRQQQDSANAVKKAIAEHGDGLKPKARVPTLHSWLYTIFNAFSPHCESKQSAFENIDGWKKYRKPPKPLKMAT